MLKMVSQHGHGAATLHHWPLWFQPASRPPTHVPSLICLASSAYQSNCQTVDCKIYDVQAGGRPAFLVYCTKPPSCISSANVWHTCQNAITISEPSSCQPHANCIAAWIPVPMDSSLMSAPHTLVYMPSILYNTHAIIVQICNMADVKKRKVHA